MRLCKREPRVYRAGMPPYQPCTGVVLKLKPFVLKLKPWQTFGVRGRHKRKKEEGRKVGKERGGADVTVESD
jgi:hypothetical protein